MLEYGAPPLDFSFKELRSCSEMETEEPREGGKRRPPVNIEKEVGQQNAELDPSGEPVGLPSSGGTAGGGAVFEGPASARSGTGPIRSSLATGGALVAGAGKSTAQSTPRSMASPRWGLRKVTIAVKLNNNSIDTVSDLPQALEFVMDDPLRHLRWVDLSFNHINKIEPALLAFQNLKALYLHGNQIKSLPSVERLRKLKLLISLTLNGNPIESSSVYRTYVVGALTSLRTLDHTSITDEEKLNSNTWFTAHTRRAKVRRERLEEAYLASQAD
jgi:hypothetical protein